MRIVAPVRLTSEPGAKLDAEVGETRRILTRFRKGGFEYALWAVAELPERDEDLKPWLRACLKAFPGKVILAVDSRLEQGEPTPPPERIARLAEAAGRRFHAVLLNYEHLNNFTAGGEEAQAIQAVRRTGEAVRSSAPKTPLWLLLDDGPDSAQRMPAWVEALGDTADGFYLSQGHGLDAMRDDALAAVAAPLLAGGKAVIRGEFGYAAPRLRPGIEDEMRRQYGERMARYEAWVRDSGYAGYSRVIGQSIPGAVQLGMALLSD